MKYRFCENSCQKLPTYSDKHTNIINELRVKVHRRQTITSCVGELEVVKHKTSWRIEEDKLEAQPGSVALCRSPFILLWEHFILNLP
jgi:hypothetical protein